MKHKNILIIEDDPIFRSYLEKNLNHYGRIFRANTKAEALEILNKNEIYLALIDLNLNNEKSGFELIKVCSLQKTIPIVLTSFQDDESIELAYEMGCRQYLIKTQLLLNFHENIKILSQYFIDNELKKIFEKEYLTSSPPLISVLTQTFSRHFDLNQKILITGPTGIGKTKLAKIIHQRCGGDENNFIHINLAEITETLFESILFGHKKGSFTGALNDNDGLLMKANGGTLFLDEIGILPVSIQKKLLRVLEEKSFTPVGGNKAVQVKFRLITATCDNLGEMIKKNKFREDFYYRIRGHEIKIPALNERTEDISLFINYFNSLTPNRVFVSKEAMQILLHYRWPGNIRELESLVNQWKQLNHGLIKKENLESHLIKNNASYLNDIEDNLADSSLSSSHFKKIDSLGQIVFFNQIEKEIMIHYMKKNHGKVNDVQKKLQISKSLFYRIHRELIEEIGEKYYEL